ncbi:MliC family protein [Parahaliea sp. F7430]|uniref:MliC family protein n=1 Tax=Sediminihaliea albiluteola TaxID=2758564 RepID=A0A7W2YHS2_9GAMM|nr:MliC family protein [Sediminihaliea albiluteola]MBA6411726.1 MliC family protein [Sediminihaliea albiluteola]
MKNLISTAVMAAFITACGQSSDESNATSAAGSQFAPFSQSYSCESGQSLEAEYSSTETVVVHYQENTQEMKIAVSASGARYAGEDLEWWIKGSGKGSEGVLFDHQEDGTTGEIIDNCIAD